MERRVLYSKIINTYFYTYITASQNKKNLLVSYVVAAILLIISKVRVDVSKAVMMIYRLQ